MVLTLRWDVKTGGLDEEEGLDNFFDLVNDVNGHPVDDAVLLAVETAFAAEVESDGEEDDAVTFDGEMDLGTWEDEEGLVCPTLSFLLPDETLRTFLMMKETLVFPRIASKDNSFK